MSMGRRLQIQAYAADDRDALARSRTAPARQVERAKVVLAALEGERVGAIAQRLHLSPATDYWNAYRHPFVWGRRRRHRPRRQPGVALMPAVA